MEVLCVQETKWKGDRAREMADGYKMLNAGGDGRSNGVGIIMTWWKSARKWYEWRDGRGGSLPYG